MAINREELKKLGLEDATINKVLDIHHAEIKSYDSLKIEGRKLLFF